MTPSKDMTPPRSPSKGRQRSLKPSLEATTPHLPALLSEETETEQSKQGQTANAASPPATSAWLHAAPALKTHFRLLYLQQAPLPCAGRPLSAPGLVPPRGAPRGGPVAGQLSWLSVNLPALPLKVLLHKKASPGQNGPPLICSLLTWKDGSGRASTLRKSLKCKSAGKQGFGKRSREGTILAWVLLEGRAKWKRLE